MLLLDGVPTETHTTTELEAELKKQIDRLREEPVSEAELARVVRQTVASKVFEQDSVYYQAMQLGMLDMVGLDWRLADAYVDNLKAVTAERIRAVARKYLVDDNLTVAVLEPQPMDQAMAAGGRGEGQSGLH